MSHKNELKQVVDPQIPYNCPNATKLRLFVRSSQQKECVTHPPKRLSPSAFTRNTGYLSTCALVEEQQKRNRLPLPHLPLICSDISLTSNFGGSSSRDSVYHSNGERTSPFPSSSTTLPPVLSVLNMVR